MKFDTLLFIVMIGFLLFLFGSFLGIFSFGLGSIAIRHDGQVLPVQTGSFNFAGYDGTYKTPWLGGLSSSNDYHFCGDNDGDGHLNT